MAPIVARLQALWETCREPVIRAFPPPPSLPSDLQGYLQRVNDSLLAAGGYPWTIIRVDDRDAYLGALERASIDTDIHPFARFLAERVQRSTREDG